VCIGCKACEVACKEWNHVPEDGLNFLGFSYDHTGRLGANSWRHVSFIEQPVGGSQVNAPSVLSELPVYPGNHGATSIASAGAVEEARPEFRWLMSSDVCKHCTEAGCLDVCPTGALFRTEFGTVVVQEDICNGCGYCVPACPFGVIDKREEDGRVFKCTLCYDRLHDGLTPACAKACPTESIQFGELEELQARARSRLAELHERGLVEARLYGADGAGALGGAVGTAATDGLSGVGGTGAFFLLLDEPEVYGLPPDPVVPTRDLPSMWRQMGMAALALLGGAAMAFAGRRSR
jgi:formate dehydrogenase iron-sulfur subunit